MAERRTTMPAAADIKEATAAAADWRPLSSLRRAMDRMMEDFDRDFWRMPTRRSLFEDLGPMAHLPATDMVETDHDYRINLELPGLSEENIEVKVANRVITISGEKKEEKEESRKDFYLSERRFGSFRRSFNIPEGVDTDRIEAGFDKGVLRVTMPKSPEARQAEKRIAVKTS